MVRKGQGNPIEWRGPRLPRNGMFSVTLAPKLPYNGAVLILSLDTSSRGGSIAILRDELVLGVVSTWGDEAYSSRIFRQLEFLLGELSLRLDQFDLFAVAAGPGSFTGLRVGLASAKAWAEAYSRPVVGVSVLEAVASQCSFPAPVLVPVVDARRGQFYTATFRRAGNSLAIDGDEHVASGEELSAEVRARLDALGAHADGAVGSPVAVVTTEPQLIADVFRSFTHAAVPGGVPVFRASNVLAPWIGHLAQARALRGEVSDALTLDANYVRRSDAEVDAKAR
jgi:tRNA threonylcarbamoyladenosine biosynthesis protein TsaB